VAEAISSIVRFREPRLTALGGGSIENVASVNRVSPVVIATIVANTSSCQIRAKPARRHGCRFASNWHPSDGSATARCLRQ
jgi:hypothetical protein